MPQLVELRALSGSSKMFGASVSNIERSFGSVFFFFFAFFPSLSPAPEVYGYSNRDNSGA